MVSECPSATVKTNVNDCARVILYAKTKSDSFPLCCNHITMSGKLCFLKCKIEKYCDVYAYFWCFGWWNWETEELDNLNSNAQTYNRA